MQSLWQKTATPLSFEALRGDIHTNVLIIGGGMAGILCAYELTQAGIDAVVAEADRIGGGVSAGTTAKITSQHGLIYADLIRRFGKARAAAYLRANEEALATYRRLSREMDCAYEEVDAYVYSRASSERIEQEIRAVTALGGRAELIRQDQNLPFPISAAIRFPHQAQFHPLRFLYAIASHLRIYEQTPVRELIGMRARTDRGSITAKHIIVATHFPFLNKHGSYFLKLYQQRSYVLALKNIPAINGVYLDQEKNGISLRQCGEHLLIGGGGHRTGKDGGGWRALSDFVKQIYPNAREDCRWATQDCMTLDGIPYIGRYSARTPSLYVATGFNKWGMTSSMVAARLLKDLICGIENPYAALFSPSRSVLRPQLALNGAEAIYSLLAPTSRRCPHMGCALKWNKQEHTWDCPCHGSRFTEWGELINNPATKDLPKK